MHELAISEAVLEIALRNAAEAHAITVTDIYIRVGELSGIEPACMEFHWDIVARNTPAAQARLHFTQVPMRLACLDCGAERCGPCEPVECSRCGGRNLRVSGGDELQVESIDIEGAPREFATHVAGSLEA